MPLIHQRPDWPRFRWDPAALAARLAETRFRQGRLIGRMEAQEPEARRAAAEAVLAAEALASSTLAGVPLASDAIQQTLAGSAHGVPAPAGEAAAGMVRMLRDAAGNHALPLDRERLVGWQSGLPGAAGDAIPPAIEGSDYDPPPPSRLPDELASFLDRFNHTGGIDPVLKAALSLLWLETIRPFDHGNGRLGRAVALLALSQAEGAMRYYSLSDQILREREAYGAALQAARLGDLDVTGWFEWMLGCLGRAIDGAETLHGTAAAAARFWHRHGAGRFNRRQRTMLQTLLDGEARMVSSSDWASATGCSQDTAGRDISDLIRRHILMKDAAGGRSTRYGLVPPEEGPRP